MNRKEEMLREMRDSKSEFVTYGDGDLGIPVERLSAINDIESMDEEAIGDGAWFECTSEGEVL
jgi:hypothetical protein